MSVSVALIVRNEEGTLARCLASLRAGVDEIVVVDTGSTDGTRRIAARFTDRIVHFAWRRDFAAARQFAFDQTRGDWIVWLDADDVVHGADGIRALVAAAPADVAGFYWRYVVDRDARGSVRFAFWRERCVRRDAGFRWQGRVHEVLVAREPRRLLRSDAVVVEHRPLAAGTPADPTRNLDILLEDVGDAARPPAPRSLFYLAREYADLGRIPEAIATYERYLAVSAWDDERYAALTSLAELHRGRADWAAALDADQRAAAVHPRWPDAYFGQARTHYHLGDWTAVVRWSNVARALPPPDTLLFVRPLDSRLGWIIYYTNALYHLGDLRGALDWTRVALRMAPDDPSHRHNMLVFAGALHAGEVDDFGAIPAGAASHGG
jgi:glycosyltransferase involved in cell wall biosynthesis